jgi:Flp pilus assembly protein TadG
VSKLRGRRRPRTRLGRGEDGYVLALFAMLLVALLGFAGFGVDVGAWYGRAAEIQRAVDAAAMAGVVYLPADFAQAQTVACTTLARNGIDCSDTTKYDVDIEMATDRRLRVTVRDRDVKAYFSKVFFDRMPNGIRRTSLAEYLNPVPLGSPESRFGTGDINFGGGLARHFFWGSVSPFCTPKEMGDQILSWTDGQAWGPCPPPYGTGVGDPVAPQPNYRASGYDYYIDVAASTPSVAVRLFDVGFCATPGNNAVGPNGDFSFMMNPGQVWNTPFNTEYRLYRADSTPLDDTDNPQFGSTMTYGLNQGCNAWTDVFTMNAPTPGRWRLNIRTQPGVNVSGHNNWGLWAKRPADSRPCNTISTPSCPKVYAKDRMSITVDTSSSTPQFYLAEINPVHQGKHLEIQLWDPGDGMDYMQILNPNGTPVPFKWRTTGESNDYGVPTWLNNDTCSGQACLRVDGIGATPSNKPNRLTNIKFNDRLVVIDVALPNSFAAFPNNWWRIRYSNAGDVYDRTTWAAVVRGDPVHLINE